MLHHIATISVCYGGHFESKMTAKIQKSSDLGEIWYYYRHDTVWSEFNFFCTLVTMATAAILNLFNPSKADIPTKFHEVSMPTGFFIWGYMYPFTFQFIFFVHPNEELEGTLHPQKFGCTPKNEGKRVHVPPDEKTCGHADFMKLCRNISF
jgi:hypothetical protein